MTPLDLAHAAMTADPQDDAARLAFYAAAADAELFLLLQDEAEGTALIPRLFPLDTGPVVLAFDTEERLADFACAIVPYAALPGRVIAAQLAGQGVGLGLNLGVAPSAFLMGAEAVDWLADLLSRAPEPVQARPRAFHAPGALPPALLARLRTRLAPAAGRIEAALIAAVTWAGGRRGHLLALVGADPAAAPALARAAAEALVFSGLEAGEIDVVVLPADDPAARAMAAVALRLDLPRPAPAPAPAAAPAAPGMDPARPPRLR